MKMKIYAASLKSTFAKKKKNPKPPHRPAPSTAAVRS